MDQPPLKKFVIKGKFCVFNLGYNLKRGPYKKRRIEVRINKDYHSDGLNYCQEILNKVQMFLF